MFVITLFSLQDRLAFLSQGLAKTVPIAENAYPCAVSIPQEMMIKHVTARRLRVCSTDILSKFIL